MWDYRQLTGQLPIENLSAQLSLVVEQTLLRCPHGRSPGQDVSLGSHLENGHLCWYQEWVLLPPLLHPPPIALLGPSFGETFRVEEIRRGSQNSGS